MVLQNKHLIFLLLIYTLCYTATIHGILLDVNDAETCNLLCEQCNASAIFLDDYCECNFTDENDKDTECIQRIQREIQTIDLNVLSDDLTDEERIVRSILKSRHRLRTGDADKVAQYFISGGPSAGHSPFIKYNAYESMTNSVSDIADKHNPENKFYDISQSSNSPVSRNTYNPPLYVILEAVKQEDPARERSSLLGITNSILNYPINGWYGLMSPLLGSAAQPYGPYGHELPLHHSLLRTASLPTQVLQNLLARRLSKYPAYYGDIVKGTIPSQDVLSSPFVDRSYKYAGNAGRTSYDSSTARTNDKSIAASVPGSDFPIQSAQFIHMPYIFGTNTLHDPMQYRYFASPNSQYAYYNPLTNILHPLDGYIVRPISHLQSTANQIISVPNPTAYHTNNANFEQQTDVSVITDKTVNTDDKTKELNNVNIVSKEGKKIENNADSNKS